MTLDPDYFKLLEHLGPTVTVAQLAALESKRPLVALRHDVDHNLDYALEMAFWEARAGRRATYFLLNTTDYWHDPDFELKVRQLADFGHEIGLHVNSLAAWYQGLVDDPIADLRAALARLRECGAAVEGVAAHGDKACYAGGFTNFWLFADVAGSSSCEDGISAEGIRVDDPAWQIRLPSRPTLQRGDGSTVELWSASLADLGLDYLASHIPFDLYFTDSGGGWIRSPDPRSVRGFRRSRAQVLVHPIHWRGPPRRWFFLSTARSGSTWLARVLNRASSTQGLHEFTLNHRFDGATLTRDKRTSDRVNALFADEFLVEQLLRESREWTASLEADVAEANVYLVHALSPLRKVFPDATLVHLCREPGKVVRSLLNRRWYETPGDTAHPCVPARNWETASQLDRVIDYVVWVNEQLLRERLPTVHLEKLAGDPRIFGETMAELGIAFYPRLMADAFSEPVNVDSVDDVPPVADWGLDERQRLEKQLAHLHAKLGYGSPARPTGRGPRRTLRHTSTARLTRRKAYATYQLSRDGLALLATKRLSGHLHRAKVERGGLSFPADVNSVAFLTPRVMPLAPGFLERVRRSILRRTEPDPSPEPARPTWHSSDPDTTWPAPPNAHLSLVVTAIAESADVRLFVLGYRHAGTLIEAQPALRLRPEVERAAADVALRPLTTRFRLALQAVAPKSEVHVTLVNITLKIMRPIYA